MFSTSKLNYKEARLLVC